MQETSEGMKSRQKRIMTYFVAAAERTIKKNGVAGVTIRGVSELAGYTSATLYNYFDDLNHLIFLATMGYLEAFYDTVHASMADCKDPVEAYLAVCECFCRHSFQAPVIYELLLFSRQDKREAYTDQYYCLFPEKAGQGGPWTARMSAGGIHFPGSNLLDDCVHAGLMTPENARDFSEVAMMVYKCVLLDVKEGAIGSEQAVDKTMRHCRQLMNCYAKQGCVR